jgi:transposase
MKNKYMHHSHLSERKFGEPLRLFTADLNAVRMAEVSGVSRQTAGALLARMRERIAGLAEAESPFTAGEIEIDESCFGARRVRGKRGRGAYGKTKVFGMLKRGDKAYTQAVRNRSAAEPAPIIKKLAPGDSTIYSDGRKAYGGLANAGYRRHYRVKNQDDVFANGGRTRTAWRTSGASQRRGRRGSGA